MLTAPRRNAHASVKAHALLQAAVQHAGGVNAPQAAAHVHNCGPHGFLLRFLFGV